MTHFQPRAFLTNSQPKILSFFMLFLLVCFLLLSSYFLFLSPIVKTDTDLWYHLAGGRYILENHALPQDSFFSFLEPARERPDYFWLFRILVYTIHEKSGYLGLVFLRAFAYLALTSLVLQFFLGGLRKPSIQFYAICLAIVYLLILSQRWLSVRPHIFTSLFLGGALLLLERPSKKILLLPLLSLLWINLHGITYPVLVLIACAYLAEFFVSLRYQTSTTQKEKYFFLVSILLSLLLILVGTPHGGSLLGVPFISLEYARGYISELKPTAFRDLFQFSGSIYSASLDTLWHMLWFGITLLFLQQAITRKIAIRHVLLFFGSTYLLYQCKRFHVEFLWCNLPLVRQALLSCDSVSSETPDPPKASLSSLFVPPALTLFLLMSAFSHFENRFSRERVYPFDSAGLPAGNVAFLKHIQKEGFLLTHANDGGYLQWELYPQYKIAMDMQLPHLFTDNDFFLVCNALYDKNVFQKFSARYPISFIMIKREDSCPDFLKKNEAYPVVFFDDTHVLYANKQRHPDIVASYEIQGVDPYEVSDLDISSWVPDQRKKAVATLLAMQKIYPHSRQVNQLLAMIYNKEGKYEEALRHAHLVVEAYPNLSKGYRLKGDALLLQERFSESLANYQKALHYADKSEYSDMHIKLASSYLELERYPEAYASFSAAQKIFDESANFKYFYGFALAAQKCGKKEKALWLYVLADIKTPDSEYAWKQKIQEQIFSLDNAEAD